MSIKSVSLGIGVKKYEALAAAGIVTRDQDWEVANAKRRTEMLSAGKEEVRENVGDTGDKILDHRSISGMAVCGSELVEKLLTSSLGAVVYLKVRSRKGQKSYFLIVREVEAGFEEPTSLNASALDLVKKDSRKWFKNVVVWSNPDATITVNLFQNLTPKEFDEIEKVQQVRFDNNKPTLV